MATASVEGWNQFLQDGEDVVCAEEVVDFVDCSRAKIADVSASMSKAGFPHE